MGFLLQSFQRTRLLLIPNLSRVSSLWISSIPKLKNRKAAPLSDTSSDPGPLHTAVGEAHCKFSNPDDAIEVARVDGNCRMSLAEVEKSPEPVASNAMPALPVTYEIGVPQKDNTTLFKNSNGDRMKQDEITGEQYAYSSFRNILLYYPGCVSTDEDENRLFISDINHHRIVITDGDGKILDCIGSSPGFEDGEFESAQLFRPAASIYDTTDNYLYFVDSENNAIRRADMESRTLETVFPVSAPKSSGVWNWILFKLGLAKDADVKSEEFDLHSFSSPWYLLKSGDDDLVIINRSFEMSWSISMESWEIKNVTNGRENILKNYRQIIEKKITLLRACYETLSPLADLSLDSFPYVHLTSSVARFNRYTIFCDAAGHRVLKCHRESGAISPIQFSNMGVLGLPYWLISPLERVFISEKLSRTSNEDIHHFSVLPGKCDIRVNVGIPKGTELAAPLEEACIWRQARGSIAELSWSEDAATSTEKVGVAQQWFDELDNLAFSKPSIESGAQVEESLVDKNLEDVDKVHFNCAANISPGTGEILVSVALYLRLSRARGTNERSLQAMRILDLQQEGNRSRDEDACIKSLLDTGGDLKELVFVTPLHLRIRLDCLDHPHTISQNETILSDTALEVNVSLD